MLNPINNLNLAKLQFESENCDSNSRKYYEGLQYQIPQNKLHRLMRAMTSHNLKLNILSQFYPHQQMVQATVEQRQMDEQQNRNASMLISGGLVFAIHNQGRRDKVLNVLREYGRFLKTHRIFRHYIHALVLPYLVMTTHMNIKYMNQVEQLWQVHANRLNEQDLSDPERTVYPQHLNPRYY